MQKMPWPDPADPARYRGLRQRVEQLRAGTDRALFGMAPCGHDLFNQLLRVRGMEEGLMDLVANPEFAEAFLDRLTGTIITAQQLFLDEVGDLIDVHFTADDLTGQTGAADLAGALSADDQAALGADHRRRSRPAPRRRSSTTAAARCGSSCPT